MKADKHYEFSRKLYNTIEYFHLYTQCSHSLFLLQYDIHDSRIYWEIFAGNT